jgi:long-chain acyl-CoA synthetase
MPDATPTGGLLLTGASGFVGQSVLARWLARTDRPVTVLVRAADDRAALARVEALLGDGQPPRRAPLRALAADVTDFDPADLAARVRAGGHDVDEIIHAAACVRFDQELDEARGVNVAGTARMLELAQRLHAEHPLRRYVQVSTAFVAGAHAGSFGERDRRIGQAFRNTYEQSKIEAEELVVGPAGAATGLPVQIVRPSIVVGDRESGWTAAFNVLYVPLRALVAGAVDAVPEHDTGLLDVVPVDYVAEGLLGLSDAPADGRTYHLTAGRHAITVGELADLACRATGRKPPPRVSAETFAQTLSATAAGRVLAANLGDYLPYLDVRTTFDAAGAEAHLGPRGIRVTPVSDYLHRLIAFAQERRWGRLRRPRGATSASLTTI